MVTVSEVAGAGSGVVRWNPVGEWVVSERLAHEPLVDDATFLAVQGIRTVRRAGHGETRRYRFAGVVVCGVCGRRMDGHWVHGRAGYRCRHGYTAAVPRPRDAPPNVYQREERLLQALPDLLGLPPPSADITTGHDLDLIEILRRREQVIVCKRVSETIWLANYTSHLVRYLCVLPGSWR